MDAFTEKERKTKDEAIRKVEPADGTSNEAEPEEYVHSCIF